MSAPSPSSTTNQATTNQPPSQINVATELVVKLHLLLSSNLITCDDILVCPRPVQKWLILILLTFFGEFRQFWQTQVCAMQSVGPEPGLLFIGEIKFIPICFLGPAYFNPWQISLPFIFSFRANCISIALAASGAAPSASEVDLGLDLACKTFCG